jgi:hypothetical protein
LSFFSFFSHPSTPEKGNIDHSTLLAFFLARIWGIISLSASDELVLMVGPREGPRSWVWESKQHEARSGNGSSSGTANPNQRSGFGPAVSRSSSDHQSKKT